MIVLDAHEGPHILLVVVVDAMHQVEDDVGIVRRRERVLMKADARRRRHFGEDVVIVESDFVVGRFSRLVRMRECGTESGRRIALRAGFELKVANRRHYQKVAEIRMAGTAEMRVRKSDDRAVVVLVAGAVSVRFFVIFSADVVRLLIGVGRKLYRTEWHRRSGIRVSHLLCPDQRVYVANKILWPLCQEGDVQDKKRQNKKNGFHFYVGGMLIRFS